mmetsp:Transcript_7988/g.19455  ORF Transcript_7988/g.19455 Transcript_7988/m.19455 type:complete len:248 (+) Transcript_7988:1118-1861(+)
MHHASQPQLPVLLRLHNPPRDRSLARRRIHPGNYSQVGRAGCGRVPLARTCLYRSQDPPRGRLPPDRARTPRAHPRRVRVPLRPRGPLGRELRSRRLPRVLHPLAHRRGHRLRGRHGDHRDSSHLPHPHAGWLCGEQLRLPLRLPGSRHNVADPADGRLLPPEASPCACHGGPGVRPFRQLQGHGDVHKALVLLPPIHPGRFVDGPGLVRRASPRRRRRADVRGLRGELRRGAQRRACRGGLGLLRT